MEKKKVAFICVHNSCRSQIAEALGKYLAGDVFESYSAGTETKPQVNQDAVKTGKGTYPLVVMVNGTGVAASKYKPIFEHLASWSFIVIGNEDVTATITKLCMRQAHRHYK